MKSRLLLVLALVCAGAHAMPGAAHADPSLDAAKLKFDAAQADFAARSFNKAAEGFLEAYALRNDITELLYNAAAAYEEQGKSAGDVAAYANAVKYYGEYLAKEPNDKDSANIKARLAPLEAEIARLKANPPPAGTAATASEAVVALGDADIVKGVYVIESNPSNAEIYLDSEANGVFATTPWSGVIEGNHTLIFRSRGYRPHTAILPTSPNSLVVKSVDMATVGSLGYLTVTSDPVGAKVFLDDKAKGALGETPFAKDVVPGKHTIYVTADGYEEFSQEIEIAAGETPIIDAKLSGAPVGYLNMRGDGIEDSKVYIDGELACDPGPCRRGLKEGVHVIKVTRAGYKDFTKKVEIQQKAETTIKIALAPVPSRIDAVVYYALTGAFIGGGVFFGVKANSLRDEIQADIDAGNPPVDENDPRFGRGKIYALVADGMWAVSAITFFTAVYYTFREKGPPSRGAVDTKSLAITPTLGVGAGGYAGLDMEVHW